MRLRRGLTSCLIAVFSLSLLAFTGCNNLTPPSPSPATQPSVTFADQIASAADIAYGDLTNPLIFPAGVIPASDLAAAKAADLDLDSLAKQYDAGTLSVATFTAEAAADALIIYTIANKPAAAGKVNTPAITTLKTAAKPAARAILK